MLSHDSMGRTDFPEYTGVEIQHGVEEFDYSVGPYVPYIIGGFLAIALTCAAFGVFDNA